LEARRQKTPYKVVAQRLQKTELACRLHYHQLTYGSRRKRAVSSAAVEQSLSNHYTYASQLSGGTASPPERQVPPISSPSSSPPRHVSRSESPSILQVPASMPWYSVPVWDSSACNTSGEIQPLESDLDKTDIESTYNALNRVPQINEVHLDDVYDQRHQIWTLVAQEYASWAQFPENASSFELEASWLRRHALSPSVAPPPQPNMNSQRSNSLTAPCWRAGAFSPSAHSRKMLPNLEASATDEKLQPSTLEQTKATCTIANLLTDDQDIWSGRRHSD